MYCGRSTVTGVPAQLFPASWQVEQAVAATAACTIAGGAVPVMLLNLKVVTFAAAWQVSQAVEPKGTWFAGGAFVAGVPMNVDATLVAWQVAQATPGTAACTMPGGAVFDALLNRKVVKFVAAWQLSQAAVPNGMWLTGVSFRGFAVHTPAKLSPAAWHCAHLFVMPAWLIAYCV
jgi:hypothetical protein